MNGGSFRLGYNTFGFSRTSDLDRILGTIADAGFEGVELSFAPEHLHPSIHEPIRFDAARRRIASLGLTVVCGGGGRHALGPVPHRPSLVGSDGEGAERIRFWSRCIEGTRGVGADILTLHSGPLPEGTDRETAWGRLERGLADLLTVAEREEVVLAIEFHPNMFVRTLADYREVRRRLPHDRLRLNLDIGHVRCLEEEPIPDVIEATADETVSVHLEDIRGREHVHLPVGEGEIDFRAAFGAFTASGFGGLVAAEFHSGEIDRDEAELCRTTFERLAPLR